MKKHFIQKIATLLLSGALLATSANYGLPFDVSVDTSAAGTRVSVHDPSIVKDTDGTYYVFGSHIAAASSTDLQNWTAFQNVGYETLTGNTIFGNLSQNLESAFDWAGEDMQDCAGSYAVWAPDVFYDAAYVNDDGSLGAYLMYFCTSSTYMRSVICYAVSQDIEGPYTFVDTLIYSGFTQNDQYVGISTGESSTRNVNTCYTNTNISQLSEQGNVTYNSNWFNNDGSYNNYLFPNAIDPTVYTDTDGNMWMCYGSWSGGIFTLQIDPSTGRLIHPDTGTTSDGRMIDSYFGTKISGGYYKSGEGPFMEYNAETGYYYLWVTYGGLLSEGGYNMRVFRSKNPDGPFYDAAGNPAVLSANTDLDSIGLKVMGNYLFRSLNTAYMACGHNSVLCDDDGQWYLVYHARFNDGSEYHEVRVHTMYFNAEGWPVVSPYEYGGDTIAEYGYDETDIVGTYEFINHGNDTSSTIHSYSSITLNADGTISGAETGTWYQASDSAEAVITIDDQDYYGYFLAAQDENGKTVMSFTAVGSNNQTIWGAQTTAYTGTERTGLIDYTNRSSNLVYNEDSAGGVGSSVTLCGTELLSGVSYYITNKNSGMVLDLADGNTADGTNVQQWTKTGGSQQEWRIVSVDNEYCKILSLTDESKCIAVEEYSAGNGLNVELQTYTGKENQLWKLVQDGAMYGIVSKCSGDTAGLDVYDWSTENGGNINQWEYWGGDCQLWYISPVYPVVNSGDYTIRNLNSGLFLAENDGTAVQSSAETWTLTQLSDGTYTILSADGQALTVANSSSSDGTDVILSEDIDEDSQKFTIQCNKDGSYTILSVVSDSLSCLDVYEISTEDGANICQWSYWGGDGQKFIIEPAIKSEKIMGDVNADGKFNIADLVMLQNFLLGSGMLTDWQTGDLFEDGRINVFDMVLMRRLFLNI